MDSKKGVYISMAAIIVIAAFGVGIFSFISRPPEVETAELDQFDSEVFVFEGEIPGDLPSDNVDIPDDESSQLNVPVQEVSAESEGGDESQEVEDGGEETEEVASENGQFNGTVIAGSNTPFIDFNTEDFNLAQSSDKIIVLYFYANWCPICRAETLVVEEAFNDIDNDKVVGFRVNFDDDDTDDVEKELAKKHSVINQHTKVIIKPSGAVSVDGEPWAEKEKYIEVIEAALRES